MWFQAKYEKDKKMLAKKSKKAQQSREEIDRVVLDMDETAFPLEYRMVGTAILSKRWINVQINPSK